MHRSIDGISTRQATYKPRPTLRPQLQPATQAATNPVAAPLAPKATTFTQKPAHTPTAAIASKPSFRERMQTPLIIAGCAIAGIFSQSLWFGLAAIAAYTVCMLIFRINSRTTFSLAFISLITVVLLLLVKQDTQTASNFATYTFLLLVLGVIALSFEARPQHRRKRRNGR